MNISKIEIKNFKSIEDVCVDLNKFNVIVGASASGKSNFIESFQFLKNVCEDFEKGINIHGGHFFQNINLDSDTPSCIKVTFNENESFLERTTSNNCKIQYNSIEYELCINFKENIPDVINETVKFNFDFFDKNNVFIKKNSLIFHNQNFEISAKFLDEDKNLNLDDFAPKSLLNIVNNNLKEKQGLIINSPLAFVPVSWKDYFQSIKYYNFDPKFCRFDDGNAQAVLSELGQNLPIVLEKILADENNRRKYINLVSILLPYIDKIDVFRLEDNRRMFRLSEKYNKFPILSPFVSDGTLNILALISALYFESGDIILIEEPERNIHPALFIQLVGMMKEVSLKKQVIITTHSPEILNYCDLKDIHLISRNNDGFSKISKPIDNDDIQEFIDELGIGQVFVDNYLEFGNE